MYAEIKTMDEYLEAASSLPKARISPIFSDKQEKVGNAVLYNWKNDETANLSETALSVVSDKFILVNNSTIMEQYAHIAESIFAEGGEGFVTERMGMFRLSLLKPVNEMDEYKVGVLISNSVSGKSNFYVEPFIVRLVCTNGATMRTFSEEVKKIRHLLSQEEMIKKLLSSDLLKVVLDDYLRIRDNLINVSDETILKGLREKLTKKKVISDGFLKKYEDQWGRIKNAQDLYDAVTYKGSHSGANHFDFHIMAAAEAIILESQQHAT